MLEGRLGEVQRLLQSMRAATINEGKSFKPKYDDPSVLSDLLRRALGIETSLAGLEKLGALIRSMKVNVDLINTVPSEVKESVYQAIILDMQKTLYDVEFRDQHGHAQQLRPPRGPARQVLQAQQTLGPTPNPGGGNLTCPERQSQFPLQQQAGMQQHQHLAVQQQQPHQQSATNNDPAIVMHQTRKGRFFDEFFPIVNFKHLVISLGLLCGNISHK
jgi:hypothetical protein